MLNSEEHIWIGSSDEDDDLDPEEPAESDGGLLDEWDQWDGDLDEFDPDEDADEWDEPEPLVEYDGELRRPVYVIGGDDDATLGIELRIDQWVDEIDDVKAKQRYSITELLKELRYSRLRRLLPWLAKQRWTGESILLFLRFRVHWESSPHWWANSHWDWRTRCWYPTHSRYNLSLDDTYELVHRRLDYRPNEIVDATWLGDWLNLALWQHGFLSFASFAVFRAGFSVGDNWLRYIDWYARNDLDSNETGSRWSNGHHIYRYGPPLWFAEQNWYEPNEWHDNLGW